MYSTRLILEVAINMITKIGRIPILNAWIKNENDTLLETRKIYKLKIKYYRK